MADRIEDTVGDPLPGEAAKGGGVSHAWMREQLGMLQRVAQMNDPLIWAYIDQQEAAESERDALLRRVEELKRIAIAAWHHRTGTDPDAAAKLDDALDLLWPDSPSPTRSARAEARSDGCDWVSGYGNPCVHAAGHAGPHFVGVAAERGERIIPREVAAEARASARLDGETVVVEPERPGGFGPTEALRAELAAAVLEIADSLESTTSARSCMYKLAERLEKRHR